LVFLLTCCVNGKKQKEIFYEYVNEEKVVIYLKHHQLDSIPADIKKLIKAKSLTIATDSLSGWVVYPPESVLQQKALQPPFKKLPEEITQLSNLEYLSLTDLNVKTLPNNFDKLQKLETLVLIMNKLTIAQELPKLEKLKNLKRLDIWGNIYTQADVLQLKKQNPNLLINGN
jgi:Leucine-rich repeat (LRR) protein